MNDLDDFDALILAGLESCQDADCVLCGPDLLAVHD
jgi:hypothetical protein